MHTKDYQELKDRLCEELEEIARKPEMGAGDLEVIHKLTDTIKNIDKIEMMNDDGYSGAGDWEAMGRGHFGDGYARNYDRGNSYRGRKRDSMGRYSRDGRRMGGRYSRDDGKEHLIDKLEDMMEDVDNERAKNAIRKAISELEKD